MADEFDFVIIGAGSAGCVLANRLSADPSVNVCLIEAGPADRHPLIHLPLGIVKVMQHKRLTWNFETVPQEFEGGRKIPIPAGRVLGGSSSINGMVYTRGHPRDYDAWAEAGNAGWGYRDVLPYFLRSENNLVWRNSPYHGASGEMTVDNLRSTNQLSHDFVAAAASLQYPICDDFNGPRQEGFGMRQLTQRNGRRESAATAFLAPVAKRPNLRIVTGAEVERVVIEGGRAVAVEARLGGEMRRIAARREIVVSCGAIGSPMLLLRSGIGAASALRRDGIAVVADLPGVGANLQDHVSTHMLIATQSTVPYGISLKVLPRLVKNFFEYALFRRGLLATNGVECGGFLRTSPDLDRPNLQFAFLAGFRNPNGRMGFGHGYGLSVILVQPKSRGTVGLAANDRHRPNIDPHFLEAPEDVETLVKGLQIGRQILAAPALAQYDGREVLPGVERIRDDDLADYVRQGSRTAFHPVGTCKMGIGADAVVDPRLRVRGIAGLRVVDASVFPRIITGNTNAPVTMIAEKGADFMLGRPVLPPAVLPDDAR